MKTTSAEATTGGQVVGTAARQSALGLIGAVLAGLSGLVLTLVVSRMLPASQTGIYFTVVAAFMITTTLLMLGTDTGLVRELSGARAAGRIHHLRSYLRIALVPVTVLAAIVSVIAWLVAGQLRHELTGHQQALAEATWLIAPFLLPATVATVLLNGASRGLGSMRTFTTVFQIFLPASRPILVFAVLGLAYLSGVTPTANLALIAWALPVLIALVWAVRAVRKLLDGAAPPIPAQDSPGTPSVSAFWRATLPRAVAAAFEIVIIWSDVIVVTAILGPAQGGIYAAASRFVTSGTFAMQAVRLSVGPLLAAAFARGDRAEAAQVHRLSIRWAVLSTWPVYLAMAAFAPGVLSLLGTEYLGAATALTVLSLAMLGVVSTGNANTVLNMAQHSHWAAANTGVGAALMLGLDLLLVPRLGILGAAIGWSAAMLFDATASTLQVRYGLGVRSADRSVVLAMAAVLLGFGAPALLLRLADSVMTAHVPAVVLLFVGTAVAALCYAGTLFVLRGPLALVEVRDALRRKRPTSSPRPENPDPGSTRGET